MVRIQRRLYLPPKYLDFNIKFHIKSILEDQIKNECSKEYGYILDIIDILEINSIENTIFNVIFEATNLKPEPKKEFEGVVCKVLQDGLFIDIQSKQKMLIPQKSLVNYTFDEITNSYISETKSIKEGDIVLAIVTASQFNKDKFSCFGSLKE